MHAHTEDAGKLGQDSGFEHPSPTSPPKGGVGRRPAPDVMPRNRSGYGLRKTVHLLCHAWWPKGPMLPGLRRHPLTRPGPGAFQVHAACLQRLRASQTPPVGR